MSGPVESPLGPDGLPTLALVLAVLRVAHGLNQEQWAWAADVRAASISSYERGKLVPSHNMIGRLLKALGRPYAALDLTKRFLVDLHRLVHEEGYVCASDVIPPGAADLPTDARRQIELDLLARDAGRVMHRAVSLFFRYPAGWPLDPPAGPDAQDGSEEPEVK